MKSGNITKSRLRLFIENILVYGVGSAMNMIVPFIMLPIVTRLLPGTEYFGINDSVVIFVSFGSAIITMGMYDSMYRFYFDKEDDSYKRKVCSAALFVILITGLVAVSLIAIFRSKLSLLVFSNQNYENLIIIAASSMWLASLTSIVSAPTRMQNKRLAYILIQVITSVISYGISIPLILNGDYVYALPIAALISYIITFIIYFVINNKSFLIKIPEKKLLSGMLRFGIPLMPVVLFFWIISSLGRIILTNYWGIEYTGIYAAAGKIAMISQLIYSAFTNGWQYFAFSTMKDNDFIVLISKIFEYLLGIIAFATILLILILKPVYNIILPEIYQAGITVVPILFVAPLILMLRQTIGMHFQVKKKSLYGTLTIGFGALIALILYLLLIPKYGMIGVAVASVSGYLASLLLTIVILKKMKLLTLRRRTPISSALLITVLLLFMFEVSVLIQITVSIVSLIVIFYIYKNELVSVLKNIFKKKEQVLIND